MDEQDSTKNDGCLRLFFSLFILIGIFLVLWSLKDTYGAYKTTDWLSVKASLGKVILTVEDDHDGAISYRVDVDYEYVLNDKAYQSDRLAFGYRKNNIDNHHEIYNRLENAKQLTAYVNPSNHKEAVLVKGMNNSILGIIIAALMWNSLLIFLILRAFTNVDLNKIRAIGIPILFSIWGAGIWILTTKRINFLIEENIEVLEYEPSQEKEITPYF